MPDPHASPAHSVLSASTVLAHTQQHCDVGDLQECQLLTTGVNDTYLLRTSADKYILRVYREHWRSPSDILYEIDMLLHLHRKQMPISFPLAMKNGEFVSAIKAGKGSRQAILLTYAEGEGLAQDKADILTYGRTAAHLHNALDDFSSQHTRFRLDLDHLLDAPLRVILPVLESLPAQQADLLNIIQKIKKHISSLPMEKLEWGACHGDLNSLNAHITKDRQVIVFDFDCGGPGWRAYDIAVLCWRRALLQQDEKLWEAFLRGYTQHRVLGSLDLATVPLFVALRHIWFLGLNRILNIDGDCGFSSVNKHYFEYHLHFLANWVRKYIERF